MKESFTFMIRFLDFGLNLGKDWSQKWNCVTKIYKCIPDSYPSGFYELTQNVQKTEK